MKTDYLMENIHLNFTVDSYMGDSDSIIKQSQNFNIFKNQFDWGLLDGEHSDKDGEETVLNSQIFSTEDWDKDGFYIYTLTGDDISSLETSDEIIGFTIPTEIDYNNTIFIISKYGQLTIEYD